MKYRQLGDSELSVSEIALGSWLTYGVGVEADKAKACVKSAFDNGINFFDTANVYGLGAAETALGNILKDYARDSYVIATKVFFPMSATDSGLSRAQIVKQFDASLKRLDLDYVDLYQCHRYDEDVPLEETLSALSAIVSSGRARYIGFSEWNATQIQAAVELADVAKFVSSQPQYSMIYREPEQAVMAVCEKNGISQIVWSPLAQGLLTGKYAPNQEAPSDSRAANKDMNAFMRLESQSQLLEAIQQLHPIAQRLGITLSQMALAWVLRKSNVTSAIIGASRPAQVTENCGASGIVLDEESLSQIDTVLAAVI